MSTEEAIAWCIEHNVRIDFSIHAGLHWVRVYLWRDGGEVAGAGYTLVEAVKAAVDFWNRS